MRRTRKNLIRVATAALVVFLVAFAIWTVDLITDVRGLRATVESNVAELQALSGQLAAADDQAGKAALLDEIERLRSDNRRASMELGARWAGLERALMLSLALVAANVVVLLLAPGVATARERVEVMSQAALALGVGVGLVRDSALVEVDPSLDALVSGWGNPANWWGTLPRRQRRVDMRDPFGK